MASGYFAFDRANFRLQRNFRLFNFVNFELLIDNIINSFGGFFLLEIITGSFTCLSWTYGGP